MEFNQQYKEDKYLQSIIMFCKFLTKHKDDMYDNNKYNEEYIKMCEEILKNT